MSILGESLRLYCAANNLSQKSLAESVGTSEATISRMLNEGRLPDAQTLTRLHAWMVGEHIPRQVELAERVRVLEETQKRNAPAVQAAGGLVRLGGGTLQARTGHLPVRSAVSVCSEKDAACAEVPATLRCKKCPLNNAVAASKETPQ